MWQPLADLWVVPLHCWPKLTIVSWHAALFAGQHCRDINALAASLLIRRRPDHECHWAKPMATSIMALSVHLLAQFRDSAIPDAYHQSWHRRH